ncbi:MAG TPA: hotdog domain-containing protein, partial [Myxococcota bacterium]|nr:hotdog domain-containing protein [Myxococcota bacterium]
MGVVHHSNYVRFLELARIVWLDEHHRPYRDYVADGLHFATTRVEVDHRVLGGGARDDGVAAADLVRHAERGAAHPLEPGDDL